MKVAYWSNYEKSGVTSNLSAISIMMSFVYDVRLMVTSNHFNHMQLGYSLLGSQYKEAVKEEYLYSRSANERYHDTFSKKLSKRLLPCGAIEVIDDGLFYVLQNPIYGKDTYEYSLNSRILPLLDEYEKNCDCLMIDTQSMENCTTKLILKEADLIIVNLRQDKVAMKRFFKQNHSILHKCLFIISEYRRDRIMIKRRFAREFCVAGEKVSMVSYSENFAESIMSGKLVDFIAENINCPRNSENHYFMYNLKRAAEMIMNEIKLYKGGNEVRALCEDVQ